MQSSRAPFLFLRCGSHHTRRGSDVAAPRQSVRHARASRPPCSPSASCTLRLSMRGPPAGSPRRLTGQGDGIVEHLQSWERLAPALAVVGMVAGTCGRRQALEAGSCTAEISLRAVPRTPVALARWFFLFHTRAAGVRPEAPSPTAALPVKPLDFQSIAFARSLEIRKPFFSYRILSR